MLVRPRMIALIGAPLLLLLVACGGGEKKAASPTTPSGGGGGAQATATSTGGGGAQATQPSGAGTVTVSITNACDLVTKDEARAALGEAVEDPQSITVGTQSLGTTRVSILSCSFEAESGRSSLDVALWKAEGVSGNEFRQIAEQVLCAGKEKVSGVGDSACWYDTEQNELQAVKGNALIDLSITGADRPNELKTLAQKVLAKIR